MFIVYCFGSFLLQDMFLNLQVFAFEGQDMTFTVNVFLSCILYRDAGPGNDRTVCKWVDSYHGYHISYVFLRRRRSFYFEKALRLSREIIVHVNQGFISDESHAFAPFQVKINLKFHVTLRSLIGLFN